MAARDPSTPNCAIKGCTRAAVRLGMCRKHAALAPYDFGVRASTEAMDAAHAAGKKWARKAQAHVRARLREGATVGR